MLQENARAPLRQTPSEGKPPSGSQRGEWLPRGQGPIPNTGKGREEEVHHLRGGSPPLTGKQDLLYGTRKQSRDLAIRCQWTLLGPKPEALGCPPETCTQW